MWLYMLHVAGRDSMFVSIQFFWWLHWYKITQLTLPGVAQVTLMATWDVTGLYSISNHEESTEVALTLI